MYMYDSIRRSALPRLAVVLGLAIGVLGTGCGEPEGSGGGTGGAGATGGTGGDAGGGGAGGSGGGGALSRIRILESSAVVVEHGVYSFTAEGLDEEGRIVEGLVFSWRSSDESVVSISDDGVATAHLPGRVEITATLDEHEANASLEVLRGEVADVVLTPSALSLAVGEKRKLSVTVLDQEGRTLLGRTVTWSVSEPSIARIDADGTVTGVGPGSTEIAALVAGGRASFTLEVVLRFVDIAGGDSHACGLAPDGSAWCWGDNHDGQLGRDTDSEASHVPLRVEGASFKQLALGEDHSCGLTDSGEVWCWGDNGDYQLGRTDVTGSAAPSRTEWTEPAFTFLASGAYHLCGLDELGRAWCWGTNSSDFELGQPDDFDDSAVPLLVASPSEDEDPLVFKELRMGRYFSCGRSVSDRLFCWGYNSSGQIGVGSYESVARPAEPLPGQTFQSFLTGHANACALTTEGVLFCWGENDRGQLGAVVQPESPVPFEPDLGGAAFAHLALEGYHSCGLDVTGKAWCWGGNWRGQLGSEGDDSDQPVEVPGDHRFTRLALGYGYSCGLTTERQAYCWGAITSDETAGPLLIDVE